MMRGARLCSSIVAVVLLGAGGCSQSTRPTAGGRDETNAKREAPPPARDAGGLVMPEAHKDEPEDHEELPSKVRLSAEVIAAAGIRTTAAVEERLPSTANLTGEIVADPDRSAKVALRVAGRIVDVRFREGDRVKPGDVLLVVESKELAQARALYISTMARADAAHKNAERLERVAAKGLAAGQEVADAQAQSRSLEADAHAARQTLSALGPGALDLDGDTARLTARAPIGGFVLRRDAMRGQTVPDAHVVAEIADLDRVWFLGRLFEKDLARVKVGGAAEIRLNAYPDEVFEGVVESIGRQLDPAARTVLARVVLRNRGDLLKVGLFGAALVVMAGPPEGKPRVVVPLSAVTKIADHDTVFVRQPDGDFEVHPVTLGRSAAGKIEIVAGLRAAEQVVSQGVFTLKSSVLKSTFGEED